MKKIGPVSDPRWSDADFRTTKFQTAVALSGLDLLQVSENTGRTYSTVRGWHSGRSFQIPTAELRPFLYDLAERDREALA